MAVSEAAVWAALETVKDPEIPPVSVVELGIVDAVLIDGARVTVRAVPTYMGCPALEIIRRDIAAGVRSVPGVAEVSVDFVFDPPWSSDRITPAGEEKLRSFGIATAPRCAALVSSQWGPDPHPPGSGPTGQSPVSLISLEEPRPCPYCGSQRTHLENPFGPTACRSIYYCDACRNPFEAIKPI